MKKIDYLAVEHAKRFSKQWDYFILSCQGYRSGYIQSCKDHAHEYFADNDLGWINEEIQVETLPGEQQLTPMSFETWRKQNESMPLKDALKTYLPWFDFTDLRVEEKDGKISFQGVAKRENN